MRRPRRRFFAAACTARDESRAGRSSHTRTALQSLAVFALALACIVAGPPGCGSKEETVSSPCDPNNPKAVCQTRLTLLHTADIHSRLFPYDQVILQVDSDLGLGINGQVKNIGGIARMAYIIGRERARAGRLLHLDSGDCFQGAPIFNFYSGEPEMRAVSLLGTDAMVIGNHEFDRGPVNVARQIQKWASFPVLAANYKFGDPNDPASTLLGTVLSPFTVFNRDGLKIAVIGMGNLSTLTSLFDQPNKPGILPLKTTDVAQFYIDLLRPHVDLIVMLTHLGLLVDEQMIQGTTGIDVVLGGHNHIVIDPPQTVQDCTADPLHPGYIWTVDPNITENSDPSQAPNDTIHPDPANHPYMFKRACTPRKVVLAHSGAFSKYVGRIDLELSNDPAQVSPTGNQNDYDPVNGFEVLSSKYTAFPIDYTVPEDPVMVDMLQPYQRTLDRVADLDILVGYSPTGAKRTAPQGGDSALGNLIATAMWLRLGVQTDFALTNTTGMRADLNPGPITIEEMYNIFPFDNSISKMQLSGLEVQELFDYVARRSTTRGCVSQAQIAGARLRINCAGCTRPDVQSACNVDTDCPISYAGACDTTTNTCIVEGCAEQVYIGHTQKNCNADEDCADPDGTKHPGQCDKPTPGQPGLCQSLITPTNLYELATSNYLAAGGSGYRVLQRNTTQLDTLIQQRDALNDYLRQGKPCGYGADPGSPNDLPSCTSDSDCTTYGAFVCACAAQVTEDDTGGVLACKSSGPCDPGQGKCVLQACRDDVAVFHSRSCASARPGNDQDKCKSDLNACSLAGEECKFLACVDRKIGNFTDNRVEMIGR
jgi:5'-nucleotidase